RACVASDPAFVREYVWVAGRPARRRPAPPRARPAPLGDPPVVAVAAYDLTPVAPAAPYPRTARASGRPVAWRTRSRTANAAAVTARTPATPPAYAVTSCAVVVPHVAGVARSASPAATPAAAAPRRSR